jgi:AcrR family transcriptional regulator
MIPQMENPVPEAGARSSAPDPRGGGLPALARRSVERALEPRRAAYQEEVARLVRAGSELMREKGTVDPRVGDIVRRAGLSNQAFYRHFRGKDELLLAILEDGTRELVGYLEHRMASAASPLGQIRQWIQGVLAQALVPEAAEATRPFAVNRARLAERLPEGGVGSAEALKAPLRAALARAAAGGELPGAEPEADAEAVYQLAMGWMQEQLVQRARPSEEAARALVEFALRGLRRAPDARAGARHGV